MRSTLGIACAIILLPLSAEAQCFNRVMCGDPGALEIHSQISINVPIPDGSSATDTLRTMENARRDLYALSNRECDTLKSTFGGECTLSSVNLNSSVQDRGSRSNAAYVSIANTYVIKKPVK